MASILILRRRVVTTTVVKTPGPAPALPQKSHLNAAKVVARTTTKEILQRAATRTVKTTSEDSAAVRAQQAERAKRAVEDQLKLISIAEAEIDAAVSKRDQAYKVIEAQLRLANLSFHSDGSYLAELKERWTNQQRIVDPKKFRNKVSNDAFWSSIEVSITKAKAFLSDKELTDIAEVIPSKCTGIALEVKKLGAKKRSKTE